MNSSLFFQKLLRLLRVRGVAGGIEISESMLRFAWNSDGAWHFAAVRLAPGVVRDGGVEDPVKFREALQALREQITGSKRDVPIHVIVSLISSQVYTQVFHLPLLSGDQLDHAIQLNLEVSSPYPYSETYAGWHVVGKDEKSVRYEILSAFVPKKIVDSFTALFRTERFIVAAVEPRTLALTRFSRELAAGFDPDLPTAIVILDDVGVQLMVVKGGELYFQYLLTWGEVQGDAKEISWELFSIAFSTHFRRVLAFYASHWGGSVTAVYTVSANLRDPLHALLRDQFGMTPYDLLSSGPELDAEWYSVVGSAVRALTSRSKDKGVSLLGTTAREEYWREQIERFMRFWRLAVPTTLILLLGAAWGVSIAISRTEEDVATKAQAVLGSDEGKGIVAMQEKVQKFNAAVAGITAATGTIVPKTPLVEMVRGVFNAHTASFQSLAIANDLRVTVQGAISSEEQLLALHDAMRNDDRFADVALPLQGITVSDEVVTFSMTFVIIASNTP